MPEVPLYHELKGLGRARRVPSDHGITGHNRTYGSRARIKAIRRNLYISAQNCLSSAKNKDAPDRQDPWR